MEISEFVPKAPTEPEQFGPVLDTIEELVIKNLYLTGEMDAGALATSMKIGITVLNRVLKLLQDEDVLTIAGKGSSSLDLGGSFTYALYKKGIEQAKNIVEKNPYVGPVPVTMAQYQSVTKKLAAAVVLDPRYKVTPDKVAKCFSKRIGYQELNDIIGQATASKQSIFLYGGAGNGKTNLSSFICKLLPPVLLPYCVEINKQIVKVYDEAQHVPYKDCVVDKIHGSDHRWIVCEAPFCMVGGEMTLGDLEVKWDEKFKSYRLPPHVLANGGVFLIDDLGRQQCSASDIFNRLIVPLENHIDFMVMGGTRMEVMTDEVMIFSSNLDPMKIMDPAFLRRIPYKVEMRDPTQEEFLAIWDLMLGILKMKSSQAAVDHLLERYVGDKRPFKASQPRDLLRLIRNKFVYFDTMDKEIDPSEVDISYDIYFPKGIVY